MTDEKQSPTPQKILLGLAAPAILVLAALFTSIPRADQAGDLSGVPAPLFYTSLADTISPEFVQQIGTGDITGIRFVPLRGVEARYFRYQADPDDVLRALDHLPFRIDSTFADTGVREVSFEAVMKDQVNTLSALEYERSRFFWDASPAFTAYQLRRDRIHHLVLVNPSTSEILHRVSYG